jgi:hypothetical protein
MARWTLDPGRRTDSTVRTLPTVLFPCSCVDLDCANMLPVHLLARPLLHILCTHMFLLTFCKSGRSCPCSELHFHLSSSPVSSKLSKSAISRSLLSHFCYLSRDTRRGFKPLPAGLPHHCFTTDHIQQHWITFLHTSFPDYQTSPVNTNLSPQCLVTNQSPSPLVRWRFSPSRGNAWSPNQRLVPEFSFACRPDARAPLCLPP